MFVIKLQSLHGDGIHALRAVLKALLRRHGFKCLAASEEQISEIPATRGLPPDSSGNGDLGGAN